MLVAVNQPIAESPPQRCSTASLNEVDEVLLGPERGPVRHEHLTVGVDPPSERDLLIPMSVQDEPICGML